MAQKVLLELSTDKADRPVIKIGDAHYEMKTSDDLGLKEDAEFRSLLSAFTEAEPGRDWEKLRSTLDSMVRAIVIGLPEDVLAKLSDSKKLKIVQVFTTEVKAELALASGAGKEPALAAA